MSRKFLSSNASKVSSMFTFSQDDSATETIAALREENALLRGVLDVLRVDLQIKDDQIDKVRKIEMH